MIVRWRDPSFGQKSFGQKRLRYFWSRIARLECSRCHCRPHRNCQSIKFTAFRWRPIFCDDDGFSYCCLVSLQSWKFVVVDPQGNITELRSVSYPFFLDSWPC